MFDQDTGLFDDDAAEGIYGGVGDEDELEMEQRIRTPRQAYAQDDQARLRAEQVRAQGNWPTQAHAPVGPEEPDYPYDAAAGVEEWLEPHDTSPEAAMRTAGFTVLFVAVSTGIGYAVKGGLGAVTGLLGAGALANGYRAQKWWGSADPSEKHEAVVSGLFAFAGGVGAAYLGYKAATMEK